MNAADWVPVADLVAWDKNPKPHGQENIKEIARSIRRFDFGAPIVAWRSKRQVVAGHGRLLGASLLVREDPGRLLATDAPGPGLVPVRWMEFASEAEAAAYALADNRLTEVNPMTDTAVADILREIEAEGGDINVPGYSEDDLRALLTPDVADVADPGAEEPDPQGEPDSKLGEVYELGPHRLVCGDCREHYSEFVGASCIVFDPPWDIEAANMDIPESESVLIFGDGGSIGGQIAKRGVPVWVFVWDCVSSWWTPNRPLRRIKVCAWFGSVSLYRQDGAHYEPKERKQDRVVKNTRGTYFYEEDDRGRMLSDCYSEPITKLHSDSEHKHAKPVQWMRMLIANTSTGIVVDPFGGSGTTLIACAQTGRVARLIEIDPRYCDVIRRRWTKWAREAGVDPGPGRLE